ATRARAKSSGPGCRSNFYPRRCSMSASHDDQTDWAGLKSEIAPGPKVDLADLAARCRDYDAAAAARRAAEDSRADELQASIGPAHESGPPDEYPEEGRQVRDQRTKPPPTTAAAHLAREILDAIGQDAELKRELYTLLAEPLARQIAAMAKGLK